MVTLTSFPSGLVFQVNRQLKFHRVLHSHKKWLNSPLKKNPHPLGLTNELTGWCHLLDLAHFPPASAHCPPTIYDQPSFGTPPSVHPFVCNTLQPLRSLLPSNGGEEEREGNSWATRICKLGSVSLSPKRSSGQPQRMKMVRGLNRRGGSNFQTGSENISPPFALQLLRSILDQERFELVTSDHSYYRLEF